MEKRFIHVWHVWYIYIHLVDFFIVDLGKYNINGCYGLYATTVDGKDPAITSWYGKCPIIYGVPLHPGGAGFLNHEQFAQVALPQKETIKSSNFQPSFRWVIFLQTIGSSSKRITTIKKYTHLIYIYMIHGFISWSVSPFALLKQCQIWRSANKIESKGSRKFQIRDPLNCAVQALQISLFRFSTSEFRTVELPSLKLT